MRRLFAIAVAVGAVSASGALLGEEGGNRFLHHGDRGETIHVLPPAAAVRTAHDPDPLFAPPASGATVYRASYGSRRLLDHGGLEMSNAGFWAVYWNSAIAGSSATSNSTSTHYADLQSQMSAFIASFADNKNYSSADKRADYTIIQQYGTHAPIANSLASFGAFVDTQHDGQTTPSSISDTGLQSYLASLFNSGVLTPSSNIIYGMYLPDGLTVTMGADASCSTFCGYHSVFSYGGLQIKYAVFPFLNCAACSLSGLTVGDMLTIVTSHEIREAVTDPGDFGQYAWYDASGYEADDKCAWHNLYQMSNGRFWVQPEFSNGGTVTASGFRATYPGSGCIVP